MSNTIIITGKLSDEAKEELVYLGESKADAGTAMDAATQYPSFLIYDNPAAKRRTNTRHIAPKVPAPAPAAAPAAAEKDTAKK